eukprot:GHVT01017503.1.p1 GENE.GHVT01017503.1~~GHVT01017503.1.p1  ORF type:complete len:383 (+),score=77.78 GHVT01017503.1:325-1473(+)
MELISALSRVTGVKRLVPCLFAFSKGQPNPIRGFAPSTLCTSSVPSNETASGQRHAYAVSPPSFPLVCSCSEGAPAGRFDWAGTNLQGDVSLRLRPFFSPPPWPRRCVAVPSAAFGRWQATQSSHGRTPLQQHVAERRVTSPGTRGYASRAPATIGRRWRARPQGPASRRRRRGGNAVLDAAVSAAVERRMKEYVLAKEIDVEDEIRELKHNIDNCFSKIYAVERHTKEYFIDKAFEMEDRFREFAAKASEELDRVQSAEASGAAAAVDESSASRGPSTSARSCAASSAADPSLSSSRPFIFPSARPVGDPLGPAPLASSAPGTHRPIAHVVIDLPTPQPPEPAAKILHSDATATANFGASSTEGSAKPGSDSPPPKTTPKE